MFNRRPSTLHIYVEQVEEESVGSSIVESRMLQGLSNRIAVAGMHIAKQRLPV